VVVLHLLCLVITQREKCIGDGSDSNCNFLPACTVAMIAHHVGRGHVDIDAVIARAGPEQSRAKEEKKKTFHVERASALLFHRGRELEDYASRVVFLLSGIEVEIGEGNLVRATRTEFEDG
jgi:hypothetical protein